MQIQAIVFALVFTLHNIEEALWLPQWMEKNMPHSKSLLSMFREALGLAEEMPKEKQSRPQISVRDSFLFADLGITALGYLAVGCFILFPDNLTAQLAYIGFVGAMLVNTVLPHLLLTIRYRKYCPGVLTGCLLFLPLNTAILLNAANDNLNVGEIVMATFAVGIILLAILSLLKKIADRWLEFLL